MCKNTQRKYTQRDIIRIGKIGERSFNNKTTNHNLNHHALSDNFAIYIKLLITTTTS